jgi:hypothetical protein
MFMSFISCTGLLSKHSLKLTVIIIIRLKFRLHFKFLMQRKRVFTF